jgi:hypothetical protein
MVKRRSGESEDQRLKREDRSARKQAEAAINAEAEIDARIKESIEKHGA